MVLNLASQTIQYGRALEFRTEPLSSPLSPSHQPVAVLECIPDPSGDCEIRGDFGSPDATAEFGDYAFVATGFGDADPEISSEGGSFQLSLTAGCAQAIVSARSFGDGLGNYVEYQAAYVGSFDAQ